MSVWTAPIDIYCERIGSDFWAEPVNAISNLAFIFAAIWALQTLRNRGQSGWDFTILIALAFGIGVGSFLFHTFANRWSLLTDVVPIWCFVLLIILSGLHRVGGVSIKRILIGLCLVIGAVVVLIWSLPEPSANEPAVRDAAPLNGSLGYAPAWIAMVLFAIFTTIRAHPVWPWVLAATLTFTISLGFRTVDLIWCEAFSLGTHFMWHLLNGLMIGFLLQALIRAPKIRSV